MIDLNKVRARVALGKAQDVTTVDLGFLAQVVAELEDGRAAQADLAQLQSRQGMTFGRPAR